MNLADTRELEGKTRLKHNLGLVICHFRLTANAVAAHPHVFALAGFRHTKGGLFFLFINL
jgi:hypothetical protein